MKPSLTIGRRNSSVTDEFGVEDRFQHGERNENR